MKKQHLSYSNLCKLLLINLISIPFFAFSQNNADKFNKQFVQTAINLKNKTCKLSIDKHGGAIIAFALNNGSINPYTWKVDTSQMPPNNRNGAVFQGHFLCLGRWGSPTNGEMKAGVPHNGQSTRDFWIIDSISNDSSFLIMSSSAPLDGIKVNRKVWLDNQNPVFKVTERIANTTPIGRLFNIVQHATIAPPFLDSTTVIDTNAKEGFMQTMCYPNPSAVEYKWPTGFIDSAKTSIDLTKSSMHYSYVSTHIFADSIGWVIASSPKSMLLVGYIWKTRDYPWINIWNQVLVGKLWAKGLEFGTTGIGKSYQELLSVDTRFHGRSSFFFLDAAETVEKSYIGFQMRISSDFNGVENMVFDNEFIRIIEKNKPRNRTFTIPCQFKL